VSGHVYVAGMNGAYSENSYWNTRLSPISKNSWRPAGLTSRRPKSLSSRRPYVLRTSPPADPQAFL